MLSLVDYISLCDGILHPERFSDYCPNGLQIEGKSTIQRVVTGVTACQALIDAAIEQQADAILVHHGYFWKGEAQPVTGIKKRRIASLLAHDISLVAYHLPLDCHEQLGNNAQLARQFGWHMETLSDGADALLRHASLPKSLSGEALATQIETVLGRGPMHINADRPIRSVAWCTGAAQGYIEQALALGVDAYISGEISEQTVHTAREAGVHYFAAGHHATERYGVKALGEYLAERSGVPHQFIDIDNPV